MPRLVYVLLTLLLLAGCTPTPTADYSNLELVEVRGRVTLDGIALAGARVEFESTDATRSTATTDAQGRYRLMFDSRQPGCPPGTKIVRIRMAPALADEEDPDAPPTSSVTIPSRYNIDSQLTAEVSDTERTFDFPLLSTEQDVSAPEGTGGL
jgi:hypothetical protein